MIETPVDGAVPRFDLAHWRTDHGLLAGITGRGAGPVPFDLGLAGQAANVGEVMERWRALRRSVAPFQGLVVSRQVHGTTILSHGGCEGMLIGGEADGHTTTVPGLLLAVSVADCIPVYVADPVRRAVALVHAGWRGTAGSILPNAIDLLVAGGSVVGNLLVHCGVGICGSCYEVGAEVFERCGVQPPAGGKGMLDLREILSAQAGRRGVENVSTSPLCSRHDAGRFFSHRGSAGADGRMVAYLGLLP